MVILLAGVSVLWLLLLAAFLALARAAALGDRAMQRAARPRLLVIDGERPPREAGRGRLAL